MSEYLIVDVSPQISVMFQGDTPVRVFADITAAVDDINGAVERAKLMIKV